MNTALAMLERPLVHQVGWALLHSLWQGTLVGVAFVVLRFALRRGSANARYLAGCLSLGMMVAMLVFTALRGAAFLPAPRNGEAVRLAMGGISGPGLSAASFGHASSVGGAYWLGGGGEDFLGQLAPVLALAWVLGVAFCSVRLTRSC